MRSASCCCRKPRCWLETTVPCGAGCCPTGAANAAPRRATWPAAAAEMGVPYTLVTGIPLPDQQIENVLASPETVLCTQVRAVRRHLHRRGRHADGRAGRAAGLRQRSGHSLHRGAGLPGPLPGRGLSPGMGHVIPDRMFWAEPEDADNPTSDEDDKDDQPSLEGYGFPSHDTKH
jgi:hydroxymethylpyrimidine/phosphomethylpyrimidine kinase